MLVACWPHFCRIHLKEIAIWILKREGGALKRKELLAGFIILFSKDTYLKHNYFFSYFGQSCSNNLL
jgi:hypothetical protein